ncbi:MAG: glutamine-hydrolyzing GMP synthase [Chthoniobacterales bacterium]|nr:glutamine-hydrolyzing GMP synthase [Chthoniobacterales bacterium]
MGEEMEVWNSHGDGVVRLPEGFVVVGVTENCEYAAVADEARRFYGLQFHPEVVHTPRGKEVLGNFVYGVCGCEAEWTVSGFIERACDAIRKQVGESGGVLLGLSGGVDSSVAAALLQRAIGERLVCIFVDNGLLRAGEREAVRRVFEGTFGMKLVVVDAGEGFLKRLRGVKDPERKRKIIGREFIRVFERTARELMRGEGGEGIRFLAQGTLYPDVIESVPIGGNPAALIKSHHNVGGLPKRMRFELVEPLRQLFKDEVREVGKELGLPEEILWRQPFPGPGLAVRVVGEVTRERLEILRAADAIVVGEMKAAGWYRRVWQSFAVLLPVRSVGVMGDERTYDYTIAVRVVESQDGMTADWVRVPYDLLGRMASRILNEVRGVNRVVYDVSSKPPATIEWE